MHRGQDESCSLSWCLCDEVMLKKPGVKPDKVIMSEGVRLKQTAVNMCSETVVSVGKSAARDLLMVSYT